MQFESFDVHEFKYALFWILPIIYKGCCRSPLQSGNSVINSNKNNSQARKNNKAGYIREHICGHYEKLNIINYNS